MAVPRRPVFHAFVQSFLCLIAAFGGGTAQAGPASRTITYVAYGAAGGALEEMASDELRGRGVDAAPFGNISLVPTRRRITLFIDDVGPAATVAVVVSGRDVDPRWLCVPVRKTVKVSRLVPGSEVYLSIWSTFAWCGAHLGATAGVMTVVF